MIVLLVFALVIIVISIIFVVIFHSSPFSGVFTVISVVIGLIFAVLGLYFLLKRRKIQVISQQSVQTKTDIESKGLEDYEKIYKNLYTLEESKKLIEEYKSNDNNFNRINEAVGELKGKSENFFDDFKQEIESLNEDVNDDQGYNGLIDRIEKTEDNMHKKLKDFESLVVDALSSVGKMERTKRKIFENLNAQEGSSYVISQVSLLKNLGDLIEKATKHELQPVENLRVFDKLKELKNEIDNAEKSKNKEEIDKLIKNRLSNFDEWINEMKSYLEFQRNKLQEYKQTYEDKIKSIENLFIIPEVSEENSPESNEPVQTISNISQPQPQPQPQAQPQPQPQPQPEFNDLMVFESTFFKKYTDKPYETFLALMALKGVTGSPVKNQQYLTQFIDAMKNGEIPNIPFRDRKDTKNVNKKILFFDLFIRCFRISKKIEDFLNILPNKSQYEKVKENFMKNFQLIQSLFLEEKQEEDTLLTPFIYEQNDLENYKKVYERIKEKKENIKDFLSILQDIYNDISRIFIENRDYVLFYSFLKSGNKNKVFPFIFPDILGKISIKKNGQFSALNIQEEWYQVNFSDYFYCFSMLRNPSPIQKEEGDIVNFLNSLTDDKELVYSFYFNYRQDEIKNALEPNPPDEIIGNSKKEIHLLIGGILEKLGMNYEYEISPKFNVQRNLNLLPLLPLEIDEPFLFLHALSVVTDDNISHFTADKELMKMVKEINPWSSDRNAFLLILMYQKKIIDQIPDLKKIIVEILNYFPNNVTRISDISKELQKKKYLLSFYLEILKTLGDLVKKKEELEKIIEKAKENINPLLLCYFDDEKSLFITEKINMEKNKILIERIWLYRNTDALVDSIKKTFATTIGNFDVKSLLKDEFFRCFMTMRITTNKSIRELTRVYVPMEVKQDNTTKIDAIKEIIEKEYIKKIEII